MNRIIQMLAAAFIAGSHKVSVQGLLTISFAPSLASATALHWSKDPGPEELQLSIGTAVWTSQSSGHKGQGGAPSTSPAQEGAAKRCPTCPALTAPGVTHPRTPLADLVLSPSILCCQRESPASKLQLPPPWRLQHFRAGKKHP